MTLSYGMAGYLNLSGDQLYIPAVILPRSRPAIFFFSGGKSVEFNGNRVVQANGVEAFLEFAILTIIFNYNIVFHLVFLPGICVMLKFLPSGYQPYAPQRYFFQGAGGKRIRMP